MVWFLLQAGVACLLQQWVCVPSVCTDGLHLGRVGAVSAEGLVGSRATRLAKQSGGAPLGFGWLSRLYGEVEASAFTQLPNLLHILHPAPFINTEQLDQASD